MTDLKPCPICGGEVSLIKNESPRLHRPARNGNYHVYCGECALLFGYDEDYGGQFDTEADAIESWNHRDIDANIRQFREWAENILFGKQHEIPKEIAELLPYLMAKQTTAK